MSAYQSIISIMADVADEPETLAFEILTALRSVPNEVAEAGVDPEQWERACEAMITVASEAHDTRQAQLADQRMEAWPEMRKTIELAGCSVTNLAGGIWRVIGTGLSIDIDLSTGEIEHFDHEIGEQLPEFEHVAHHIVRSVQSREASLAALARRKERRKTHRWDNKGKVWVPLSVTGAVIAKGK